jgi:hypothetical protein
VLALGILITEVLKESQDEEGIRFREFARDYMLLPDSTRRPGLRTGNEQTQQLLYIGLRNTWL